MITSSYNREENIIYVKRLDEIGIQDLLTYINRIDQDFQHLGNLYILDDFRNSTSKYEANDFPDLIGEIQKRIFKYNEVRLAIVVDVPFDTALSILYEELSKAIENYNYRTFSTMEAAKSWLKQGINYQAGI
jgi:hypothetical protein